MAEQNKNRRIFIVVFIVFTLIVAILALDMASRTTGPWNRPKQLNRVLPLGDSLLVDSLLLDTTRLDN
ncbi:hypothetical protein [Persicitalea jodogahamensis]|uniref:Uncharacterized protein n=1 Tax=Persicitalea jodogahamensis TaxID=402147 RepID=A0A8J3D5Q6_9BACT|nr:hypothetical protein [Persicitalea jodogahamensis]GHB78716.1 hypothetical protein GCM10007390_36400 [Persicitalea jodogahamensis]